MSNGHKLEIIQHEDGRIELIYWDWLHGQDRIYEIRPTGECYQTTDGDSQTIDLAQALLELGEWLSNRNIGNT